jgi:poly-gamma-glutamate synthesis protein (capsule biosynthesis protein)
MFVHDRPDRTGLVTLLLAGDMMAGRGIDQILPHPNDPRLYEPIVASATEYVALAERANGPIPKPVDFRYVWGDSLAELERQNPDVRLVNLETAVTRSAEPAPKGINYRMSPENFPLVTAGAINCCSLANNHTLDWGRRGLLDTLETLTESGVRPVGAGRDLREAAEPAILPVPGKGRVIVFAFGSPTSGVPLSWAATECEPGINLLRDFSSGSVDRIAQAVRTVKVPGDIVVASIHWGPNWGHEISGRTIRFAHRLVDRAGVDVVHGHSSHHAKAIEVYRDRLILYGCGDFVNDYEGISGYEMFRDDLAVMYLATVRASDGKLVELSMIPFLIRRFRLNRASPGDAMWLRDTFNSEGRKFGTRAQLRGDNSLTLSWD